MSLVGDKRSRRFFGLEYVTVSFFIIIVSPVSSLVSSLKFSPSSLFDSHVDLYVSCMNRREIPRGWKGWWKKSCSLFSSSLSFFLILLFTMVCIFFFLSSIAVAVVRKSGCRVSLL